MAKAKRPTRIDRHTTFACLSVSERRISGEAKEEIIAAFKRNGWGVLTEENGYRFIHFDESIATDVSRILDGLECDKTGWYAYGLSFPTTKATKAIVDSAEWE